MSLVTLKIQNHDSQYKAYLEFSEARGSPKCWKYPQWQGNRNFWFPPPGWPARTQYVQGGSCPTGTINFSGTGVFFTHKRQWNFIRLNLASACLAGITQASWCPWTSVSSLEFVPSTLFLPPKLHLHSPFPQFSSPRATIVLQWKYTLNVCFVLSMGDKRVLGISIALKGLISC